MKVSHELPLSLLKYGYEWNDYDYCLPNFLEYEQYAEYFKQAKKDNRFIILDNGLFEGVHYSNSELLTFISRIQPSIFIVPDEWNNSSTTLRNAKFWINNYKQALGNAYHTKLMAVCQGKDLHELILCYQTLIDLGYKHIAFNHSSIAYQELVGSTPLRKAMYGRMELIRRLVAENMIRKDVYHHLLGASLPQEVMAYKDWEFIRSIDTSNPIITGAEGIKYGDNGIDEKPTNKMEHYFSKEFDLNLQENHIIFNVNKFKEFIK